jgi:hypothetical protein
MEVNFVLIASGSIVTPRISHIIFTNDPERAKEQAIAMVSSLGKTGLYFNFDLFDVSGGEGEVNIARFSVAIQEPVVTVK